MNYEIRNSYRALELDEGASPDAVKDAYRTLVKVWHPDRFGSDEKLRLRAEEKLKEINEAYELLKGHRQSFATDAGRQAAPKPTTRPKPPPRPPPVPQAKIERVPNLRDARLGCLLLCGVGGLIMAIALIALFYDEPATNLNFSFAPESEEEVEEVGEEQDIEAGEIAESQRSKAPSVPDGGHREAMPPPTADELEQLEEHARSAAITAANQLPRAMQEIGAFDGKQAGMTGLTVETGDFLARQFYKNGLAHLKEGGGDREDGKALSWFRRAAERGHAGAHFKLATMLREGKGVAADAQAATKWALSGAALGNGDAMAAWNQYAKEMSSEEIASAKEAASKWLKEHDYERPLP